MTILALFSLSSLTLLSSTYNFSLIQKARSICLISMLIQSVDHLAEFSYKWKRNVGVDIENVFTF